MKNTYEYTYIVFFILNITFTLHYHEKKFLNIINK